jgi:hypothetical protein
MPTTGSVPERVTQRGSAGFGIESADGKDLLYQAPNDGEGPLLAMPLTGGPARQVVKCVAGTFASGSQGLYYVACDPGGGGDRPDAPDPAVHLLHPDGRDELLGTPEKFASGLAVSPDGTTILYTRQVREGADLMMIENFR